MQVSQRLEPITEDDATLAEMLKGASIPTLMLSLLHITGDKDLLRGSIRPRKAILGESQGFMPEDEKEAVRAQALEILNLFRDQGSKLPPPPPAETIHEMMRFLVGEAVPEEYVPMMLEEMELDGEDVRGFQWEKPVSAEERGRFRVLIIGAGMSGILTAIRLEEAGIPYTIIEKNDAVGGTWHENTYPGCRVDIANHFYCYSFEPNHDWPEYFSQRVQLFEYFDACVDRHGLRPHIRFGTEVVAARFDSETARWRVTLRSQAGAEETVEAHVLVSAVGQLSRPRLPDIPGRENFQGPAFHSAAWEHEHDLNGKRIAVIGTGATSLQLVPELAKTAGHLTVFQRSPAWMVPNPSYHRFVSEGKKWCLKHLPYYARWYRFLLFWPGSDGLLPSLVVDPDWPHPERSVNALNDQHREIFTQYMKSQVADPVLLDQVTPRYPPFGKRMLQDNGSWLAALQHDNVTLVTSGIREITADAVIDGDGERRPMDVVVYATGFHANRFLWPMAITGRDGLILSELWGDDPRAYLGISVPGFPNLFCLYGPSTNLAHAGSIIFHSECQVRYIMGCLKALLENGLSTMECKQDVHDAYNERLDATMAGMVWSHPGMDSWYKNSRGRVTTTSPWRLVDYWGWTKAPDLEDYDLA